MPLDPALDKAWRELEQSSPYIVGAKSGADFQAGCFRLAFLNRTTLIPLPWGKVKDETGTSLAPHLELLLLHYLLTADGAPVADEWITYRQLPGAALFAARFESMAIRPLIQAFGHDLEGFRRAGEGLGGMSMSRTGDAAFRFLALPHLPIGVVLYLGDEEVAPSVSVLFDASAPHYLPTEDLSILGSHLASRLRGLKPGAARG